jgi:peptidoglycan/LPS O-acetylase OafA/YrhL
VPVATPLGTEVGVYFLIPLMAFNASAAWIGALLGIFINYHYGIDCNTFAARYSEFLPSFLPFAVGSLVAHYIGVLRRFSAPRLSWIVWIAHGLVWFKYGLWPWTYGLYASIILTAWVIVSMDCDRSSKLDKTLGDLSYPMYLFHTMVGACFILIYGDSRPFSFFVVSFVVTMMISWIVVRCIDKPLQRMKKPRVLAINPALARSQ